MHVCNTGKNNKNAPRVRHTKHIKRLKPLHPPKTKNHFMSQIARLTTVSKILYDREVLELRKEVERLRLSLFWKDHNVRSLRKIMQEANRFHPEAPKCRCIACTISRRNDHLTPFDDQWVCSFKPWWEEKLAECDITFFEGCPPSGVLEFTSHECNTDHVLDIDSHFVNMARRDWNCFTYGAKLFKAESVQDTELQKLKKLFEILSSNH